MLKITTFACGNCGVYTVIMSFFRTAEAAVSPKTKNIKSVALIYAIILVVFAVAQLFNFNDFQVLIQSFWLPGGTPFAYFLAGFIVVVEIFALPFLMRMKVSQLMSWLSMIMGWFVALIWVFISIWLLLTTNDVSNVGFLGTIIKLTPGWWTIFFSTALAVLAIWASWGMWPGVKSKKK